MDELEVGQVVKAKKGKPYSTIFGKGTIVSIGYCKGDVQFFVKFEGLPNEWPYFESELVKGEKK